MHKVISELSNIGYIDPFDYHDIQIGVKLSAYIFIDGGIGVLVNLNVEGQFYGWGEVGGTNCIFAAVHLDDGIYSRTEEEFFDEIGLGYTVQNLTNATVNARFTGNELLVNLDFEERAQLEMSGWMWGPKPQCKDVETWGVQKNWAIDNFTDTIMF